MEKKSVHIKLKKKKKMKPQNILCFIILFAIESNVIINSCFAQSDTKYERPLSPWRVVILNHMKDSPLLAHCKSKDDDLGKHVIQPWGKYDWMFNENFWQTTLFWCYFSSKNGHTSGQVFWPENGSWLSDRCESNTCQWAAGDNGISLRYGSLDSYHLIYSWK